MEHRDRQCRRTRHSEEEEEEEVDEGMMKELRGVITLKRSTRPLLNMHWLGILFDSCCRKKLRCILDFEGSRSQRQEFGFFLGN